MGEPHHAHLSEDEYDDGLEDRVQQQTPQARSLLFAPVVTPVVRRPQPVARPAARIPTTAPQPALAERMQSLELASGEATKHPDQEGAASAVAASLLSETEWAATNSRPQRTAPPGEPDPFWAGVAHYHNADLSYFGTDSHRQYAGPESNPQDVEDAESDLSLQRRRGGARFGAGERRARQQRAEEQAHVMQRLAELPKTGNATSSSSIYTGPHATKKRSLSLWEQMGEQSRQQVALWVAKQRSRHRPISRYEALTRDPRLSDGSQGEETYKRTIQMLDEFKDKGRQLHRSPDQHRFHEAMMQAAAPHIMGYQDFERARVRLLTRHKRDVPVVACLILCPRRWGKTACVAMMVAALMHNCPGIKIVILAQQEKGAVDILNAVKKYFLHIPGANAKILKNDRTEFWCMLPSERLGQRTKENIRTSGDMNTIRAYASNISGFKGAEANLFILEEASRIPELMMSEGVGPMLMVKHTVVIGISTPLGPDNTFSKLFAKQDPHLEDLFIRFHIDLFCQQCKREGLSPKDCDHKAFMSPPWRLTENSGLSKLFMSASVYAQETLGAFFVQSNSEIPPKHLAHLFDRTLKYLHALDEEDQARIQDARAAAKRKQQLVAEPMSDEDVEEGASRLTAPPPVRGLAALRQGSEAQFISVVEPVGYGFGLAAAAEASARQMRSRYSSSSSSKKRTQAALSENLTPTVAEEPTVWTFMDPNGGGKMSECGIVSLVRVKETHDIVIVGLASVPTCGWLAVSDMIKNYCGKLREHPMLQGSRHLVAIENNYGGHVMANGFWRQFQAELPFAREIQDKEGMSGVPTRRNFKLSGWTTLVMALADHRVYFMQQLITWGRSTRVEVVQEFREQLQRMHSTPNGGISGKQASSHGADDMAMCMTMGTYWSNFMIQQFLHLQHRKQQQQQHRQPRISGR